MSYLDKLVKKWDQKKLKKKNTLSKGWVKCTKEDFDKYVIKNKKNDTFSLDFDNEMKINNYLMSILNKKLQKNFIENEKKKKKIAEIDEIQEYEDKFMLKYGIELLDILSDFRYYCQQNGYHILDKGSVSMEQKFIELMMDFTEIINNDSENEDDSDNESDY